MAFTRVRGSGITTTDNYIVGVITATKFVGQSGGSAAFDNVSIGGSLTVNGDFTTLNTTLREVELLQVDANSTVTAGIITQRGSGDILKLYDNNTEVFKVADGGYVRIPAGTNSLPSLSATTDANTGLYFAAADNVGLVAGGSRKLNINSLGVTVNNGDLYIDDKIIHSSDTNTAIRFPANDTVSVETGGSERLRIDPNGHVTLGIGVSASNNAYLTIPRHSGDGNAIELHSLRNDTAPADLAFYKNRSTSYGSYSAAQSGDTIMSIGSYVSTGAAYALRGLYQTYLSGGGVDYAWKTSTSVESMRLLQNGNLGIGTDNPQKKLQVLSSGEIARFSSTNSSSTIRLYSTASHHTELGHTGDFYLAVGGTERLRVIGTTGSVGVGIDSPTFSAINSISANAARGVEIFLDGTDTGSALKLAGDNGSGTKAWSQLGYSGANSTAHWANYNTAGQKVGEIQIGSSGNIGIGDRTSSPDADLHVHTASGESTIHVEGATNANLNLRSHSGDSTVKFSDGSASNVGNINYDHGTDSLSFRINASERLTIDSSGNITAVNTTSGSTTGVTLKVGASAASGTNSGTIIINNGGLGNASLQFDYEGSAARAKIYTYRSTNDIIFDTSGTEVFRIIDGGGMRLQKNDGNGNFTISRNASVTTTDQTIGVVDFASNTAHTVQARIMGKTLGTSNVGGDLVVETRADGGSLDERFRITGSGKVGINVTSPTTNLQIGDGTVDSDNVLKLGKRVSSSEGNLPLIAHHSANGSSSSLALCATSSSGKIHFFTGNNSAGFGAGSNEERMVITSGGNVGIGENSPDGMLHIKGTIPAIYLEDTSGTHGQTIIEQNDDNLKIRCDAGNASSGSGSNIRFEIDSAEKLRITSAGNIQLQGGIIYGDDSALPTFTIANTSGNSNNCKINLGENVGSDNGGIGFYTAGSSSSDLKMRIRGNNDFIDIIDDNRLRFHDGKLYIYHNGSNGYVVNGTGQLLHRSATHTFENAAGSTEYLSINSSGKSTFSGFIESTAGSASGRGAKLGNLSIGYDNLYNTIQALSNSTNLHLQYNVNGDIQCNEGGGDMVTADIKPRTNATFDLGTSTVGWRNIYTNDLHLNNLSKENGNDVDGTNGSWVIQEGKDDLYIINKLNGKKYRIPLEEVD